MTTHSSTIQNVAVSAPVAPEDLRRGDFVAILSETVEFPSCFWHDGLDGEAGIVCLQFIPLDPGLPLKVDAICLPFVHALTATGEPVGLDVRLVRLVRLERAFARRVRRRIRKKKKRPC